MKQRLALIRAVLHEPTVIFIDLAGAIGEGLAALWLFASNLRRFRREES